MSVPRVIIAGTHSGCGKTSVTLAVMSGLQQAGYRVQGFKVGPDYIDPSYHAVATGQPSHNLDDWMMGAEAVKWLLAETACRSDIAVIEGVMGLFDGLDSTTDEGSTAGMAKLIKAPVILVIDACSLARSVAALVKGYQTLDPDVGIAGVIFNRVGSPSHFRLLCEAVTHYNRIPVLGALPRDPQIHIPERHLGLKTASENPQLHQCLKQLAQYTTRKPPLEGLGIDLERIVQISRLTQGDFASIEEDGFRALHVLRENKQGLSDEPKQRVRLAYALDRAFQFYYQVNLDFLERCGAELVPFSPLEDQKLPEGIGGLYFGGGFPEVYAQQLEKNASMRQSVLGAIHEGIPVYAECGGLMYLTKSLKTLNGERFAMVGAVEGDIEMTDRLQNFGYCECEMVEDCFLGKKGERFRGHEFHYSRWDAEGTHPIHRVEKKRRNLSRSEGFRKGNLLASYVHCHFLSYPERAIALVEAAQNYCLKQPTQESGRHAPIG